MKKLVQVFVLSTFPCAMDGIGAKTKLLKKDTVDTIPSHLLKVLTDASLVTKKIPEGMEVVTPEVVEVEEEVVPEEYSEGWFKAQGASAMKLFLTEEYDGDVPKDADADQLAELCVSCLEDDEED